MSFPLLAVLTGVKSKQKEKKMQCCISTVGGGAFPKWNSKAMTSPLKLWILQFYNVMFNCVMFIHLVGEWHLQGNSAQMLVFISSLVGFIYLWLPHFLVSHLGQWWGRARRFCSDQALEIKHLSERWKCSSSYSFFRFPENDWRVTHMKEKRDFRKSWIVNPNVLSKGQFLYFTHTDKPLL